MTPRERVYARLRGEPVDRAPNLNILMTFASRYVGQPFSRFCQDFRVLAEANLRCNQAFGIDLLNTMSDPVRETYDYGAEVVFPEDGIPESPVPFVQTAADLKKLRHFDPLASTRILDRIRAIELYRREAGDHWPILGWVEGPLAETADLHGVAPTMTDLLVEPDFIRELLAFCVDGAIACARPQVEAGADFIGVGDAVASLVSPELYEEYVVPEERRLIAGLHALGAKVKLHVCGDINHLLPGMVGVGADVVDVDWMVDLRRAVELFRGKASVNGNYDPVAVVLQGTPEAVRGAVAACLAQGDATTFISAGCEIPRDTPHANLEAADEGLWAAAGGRPRPG